MQVIIILGKLNGIISTSKIGQQMNFNTVSSNNHSLCSLNHCKIATKIKLCRVLVKFQE